MPTGYHSSRTACGIMPEPFLPRVAPLRPASATVPPDQPPWRPAREWSSWSATLTGSGPPRPPLSTRASLARPAPTPKPAPRPPHPPVSPQTAAAHSPQIPAAYRWHPPRLPRSRRPPPRPKKTPPLWWGGGPDRGGGGGGWTAPASAPPPTKPCDRRIPRGGQRSSHADSLPEALRQTANSRPCHSAGIATPAGKSRDSPTATHSVPIHASAPHRQIFEAKRRNGQTQPVFNWNFPREPPELWANLDHMITDQAGIEEKSFTLRAVAGVRSIFSTQTSCGPRLHPKDSASSRSGGPLAITSIWPASCARTAPRSPNLRAWRVIHAAKPAAPTSPVMRKCSVASDAAICI